MFLLFPSLTLDPNCVVGKRQDSERESIPPQYWKYFCGCRCGYITARSFLISILVQNSNNSPPSPIAAVHGFLSRSLTLRKEQ